jgi:hypothetical protein
MNALAQQDRHDVAGRVAVAQAVLPTIARGRLPDPLIALASRALHRECPLATAGSGHRLPGWLPAYHFITPSGRGVSAVVC